MTNDIKRELSRMQRNGMAPAKTTSGFLPNNNHRWWTYVKRMESDDPVAPTLGRSPTLVEKIIRRGDRRLVALGGRRYCCEVLGFCCANAAAKKVEGADNERKTGTAFVLIRLLPRDIFPFAVQLLPCEAIDVLRINTPAFNEYELKVRRSAVSSVKVFQKNGVALEQVVDITDGAAASVDGAVPTVLHFTRGDMFQHSVVWRQGLPSSLAYEPAGGNGDVAQIAPSQEPRAE